MLKNRTAQLIFQTVYCTLGFVGCVASLGIFDDISSIRWDFYVHFTNISNFLCIGIMAAALIQTAKKKREQLRYNCTPFKVYRYARHSAYLPCVQHNACRQP